MIKYARLSWAGHVVRMGKGKECFQNFNIKCVVKRLIRRPTQRWEDSIRMHDGGLKSSQPSLHETRDKQPLGWKSDRNWCHCHTVSMIKLF